MITPDFPTFKKLARKGNLIAVLQSIPADLETPVSSFLKLVGNAPHGFLFESAEQDETIGRYSFIGLEPKNILTSTGKNSRHLTEIIEESLAGFKLANAETLPGFCGGYVGYLSYENVEHFEDIRLAPRKGPAIPEAIFFLTRDLLVFDHFRKILSIVVIVEVKRGKNLATAYQSACRTIAKRIQKLRQPLRLDFNSDQKNKKTSARANMSPAAFRKKVERIKEYIRAGDCIQVVLSQRFTLPKVRHDFQIYRSLRSINPSPYMFYFRYKKFRLIGSSPEMLVKKMGRDAEVRPIAGTRPRGKNSPEDLAYEENLKKSPKEMAEHLMLVDLGRNDLGRVCQFNSIRVKNFARVERYSHVMHLVSDVTGKLKPGKSAFDLLRATFPAGTVTGAPKIRAMQIINEVEAEKRGPYAGCVGYFGFNHDMDMCITIRTLFLDDDKIYLQAGAGIVKDSDPGREYQETVNKAKALVKAIEMRSQF